MTEKEFETFFNQYEKPLYNFALRWVFSSAIAEEMVQEAYTKIWFKKESIKLETLKSLLFKTVQNQCINLLNRQKLKNKLLPLDIYPFTRGGSDSETELASNEELLKIKASLEKIPQKYRQILLLSYYGEFSYKEISEMLEIAEGTVASRKTRALGFLKDQMTEAQDVI